MVVSGGGSRLEEGGETTSTEGTPMLSEEGSTIKKTIESIKEIVGNHSDADIYSMLKETNMDPNETAQKLLYQDPFHVVTRRRDKKKENTGFRRPAENTGFRRPAENTGFRRPAENTGFRRPAEPRKEPEHKVVVTRSQPPTNRNSRRGGYNHNIQSDAGTSREFRIVRDNRVNQNSPTETKPGSVQCSTSSNTQVAPNASEKSIGVRVDHRGAGTRNKEGTKPTAAHNGPSGSGRHAQDAYSNGTQGKEVFAQIRTRSPGSRVQNSKPYDSRPRSSASTTTNSVVGVYSSSSDPVHVPSPDSRSSGAVGAIKREVGVVGVRKQPSANTPKNSTITPSNSSLGKDVTVSSGSIETSTALNKTDQVSQPTVASGTVSSRSFSSSGKAHQPVAGHQKAPQASKAWKRKTSQKSSAANPGVIGKTSTSVARSPKNSAGLTKEAVDLQEKLPEVNIFENQHVIIPEHLRVPEADRSLLTFGTFDSSNSFVASGFQSFVGAEQPNAEPSEGVSAPPASTEDVNQIDILDAPSRNSESDSPASAHESAERPLPENNMSTSPRNLESYVDIGLVRNSSTSYTPAEPQEHHGPSEVPSFQVYDPQAAYDMRFYRSAMDESAQDQGLPQQEALTSHVANSIPASTVAMMQQQPVQQMYPQVHVSHYPNFMPYRQFISPMYVPPMVPSYSSNPAYAHPPNGSSYLLMPGTSSHMAATGLKYGTQQFKPIPAGNHPSGFGNFANPGGYAINAQGSIGVGSGLEDSARHNKYKDGSLGNIYIPNPQAETSEIWIQTPREIPGMQSNPYFNMQGQAPHGPYMQSHTGHASYNGATPQAAHVQFPGLYHPAAQPAQIGNPHHMVSGMGGNVGVPGAAPGGQVGPYQQSQMSHLNWAGNF
ncbi:hypothetical protein C5167_017830 [Papaver somniferum]|uniref:GBF-interacting protein 1 N-terminal domain-containing protein n=1 Tax=Papaver somniferum TaxID=3469 RepID=A0A4Y7IL17_PAPSO|nr:uncharacterized protein LOC113347596 isoform X1 [Papaver somniferum]RZC49407.1 hypothetical protein C5167_017830 [Papaver somniferum]